MSVSTLLGTLILPAILFALAYFPIVTQLSRGLLSPYAKADVKKRLFAATIDALIVATSCLLYWTSDFIWYLAAGAAYLLFRDAVRQSVGKFLLGLVVISLETGRPSSLAGSVTRNLVLVLPRASVVALFLEVRSVVRDPQGQRLGDRVAQTQVVEGLGAKDLVKSLPDWLAGFGAAFWSAVGRPGRSPERIDRAA